MALIQIVIVLACVVGAASQQYGQHNQSCTHGQNGQNGPAREYTSYGQQPQNGQNGQNGQYQQQQPQNQQRNGQYQQQPQYQQQNERQTGYVVPMVFCEENTCIHDCILQGYYGGFCGLGYAGCICS